MAKTTFSPAESKNPRTQARSALTHHLRMGDDAATDLFSELVEEMLALRISRLRENRNRKIFSKQRKVLLDRDINLLAEYHMSDVSQTWKDIEDQAIAVEREAEIDAATEEK